MTPLYRRRETMINLAIMVVVVIVTLSAALFFASPSTSLAVSSARQAALSASAKSSPDQNQFCAAYRSFNQTVLPVSQLTSGSLDQALKYLELLAVYAPRSAHHPAVDLAVDLASIGANSSSLGVFTSGTYLHFLASTSTDPYVTAFVRDNTMLFRMNKSVLEYLSSCTPA